MNQLISFKNSPKNTSEAPVRTFELPSLPNNPQTDEPLDVFLFEAPIKSIVPKVLVTIPGFILLDAATLYSANQAILCLADQRAVHSRVIFEKLQKTSSTQQLEIQQLLVPYILELTPLESSSLLQYVDALNDLGIHIKQFGPNTFTIDAIPAIFGSVDIASMTRDIIRGLQEYENMLDFHQEKEKRIALTASRAAISAKGKLSYQEAIHLIEQLFQCEQPYFCPLGKPTIAKVTSSDMLRYFT